MPRRTPPVLSRKSSAVQSPGRAHVVVFSALMDTPVREDIQAAEGSEPSVELPDTGASEPVSLALGRYARSRR